MVEADESDGTFLSLAPEIAVVTNVEPDHLDHYGSFDAVRAAFEAFVAGARSHRVVGGDDPVAAEIGRSTGADPVGRRRTARYRMVDIELARSSLSFALVGPSGEPLGAAERAGARPPQRQERRRGGGGRPGRRGPVRVAGPGPGPLRRCGPAVRVPRRGRPG